MRKLFAFLFSLVLALGLPVMSFAVTPWDDLVLAADVSALQVSITAILVLMIGITIVFVAYRYIKAALKGRTA